MSEESTPQLLTSEDVFSVQFPATKLRDGYDQNQIDDYLDEIVRVLSYYEALNASPEAEVDLTYITVRGRDVREVDFDYTRMRVGYDQDAVDDYLDQVAATLEAYEKLYGIPPSNQRYQVLQVDGPALEAQAAEQVIQSGQIPVVGGALPTGSPVADVPLATNPQNTDMPGAAVPLPGVQMPIPGDSVTPEESPASSNAAASDAGDAGTPGTADTAAVALDTNEPKADSVPVSGSDEASGALPDRGMPLMPESSVDSQTLPTLNDMPLPDATGSVPLSDAPSEAAPVEGYGEVPQYPMDADYAAAYGMQPPYGNTPGYPEQPGYADQAGYGEQPGYANQAGYGEQPGYSEQPGYGAAEGYDNQPYSYDPQFAAQYGGADYANPYGYAPYDQGTYPEPGYDSAYMAQYTTPAAWNETGEPNSYAPGYGSDGNVTGYAPDGNAPGYAPEMNDQATNYPAENMPQEGGYEVGNDSAALLPNASYAASQMESEASAAQSPQPLSAPESQPPAMPGPAAMFPEPEASSATPAEPSADAETVEPAAPETEATEAAVPTEATPANVVPTEPARNTSPAFEETAPAAKPTPVLRPEPQLNALDASSAAQPRVASEIPEEPAAPSQPIPDTSDEDLPDFLSPYIPSTPIIAPSKSAKPLSDIVTPPLPTPGAGIDLGPGAMEAKLAAVNKSSVPQPNRDVPSMVDTSDTGKEPPTPAPIFPESSNARPLLQGEEPVTEGDDEGRFVPHFLSGYRTNLDTFTSAYGHLDETGKRSDKAEMPRKETQPQRKSITTGYMVTVVTSRPLGADDQVFVKLPDGREIPVTSASSDFDGVHLSIPYL